MAGRKSTLHTGWSAGLTKLSLFVLLLLAATGLVITFAPFTTTIQWSVILPTPLIGVLTLAAARLVLRWCTGSDYRHYSMSRRRVARLHRHRAGTRLICTLSRTWS